MNRLTKAGLVGLGLALIFSWMFVHELSANAQEPGPAPPGQPVRLVFIHHSTGQNWLADDNGGLGLALAENNYFVSDTNYGWGPGNIGNRTDIPDWLEWFRGEDSRRIISALYREKGQHADYSRLPDNPGGENQVVLLKSCFPNSNLEGSPSDPPSAEPALTMGHARYVYNELLKYFITRPDKLFIVITAPPVQDSTYADNARAFNNWLVQDWLAENVYPYKNVAVYDFFNVLTGPDNHHRYVEGKIEHVYQPGYNTSYYPSDPGDDHPSKEGNLKATREFIALLNYAYSQWQTDASTQAAITHSRESQQQPGSQFCFAPFILVFGSLLVLASRLK